MRNYLRKFWRHVEARGLWPAVTIAGRWAVNRFLTRRGADPGSASSPKSDIAAYFQTLLGHEHGSADDLLSVGPAPNTLQWVIPNFGYGSGGHLNIFRFINLLADLGYEQRLVIVPPYEWKDAAAAKAAIARWYFPLKAQVATGMEGFRPSHVTLATGWQTAYWVAKYRATRERFYFVQDFEPSFYPVSSEYFLAENTYRLGLKGVTAGSWLSDTLSRDYGMRCGAISFGCETDRYFPRSRRSTPYFNILFYSRHVTKRRLFELGFVALKLVHERHPETSIIFAGGDVSTFDIPFRHRNLGECRLDELPDLYSQCDLALVLSGTNLSLLPLELAGCKCPVVMNNSPATRWLLPETAAYYAPLDPDGMADTISAAIADPSGRNARAEKAYEIAKEATWEAQAKVLAKLLDELSE